MVGIPEIAAIMCFAVVLTAELLHRRRIRSVAPLVFGPRRGPSMLVRCMPILSAIAVSLCAWGLTTLCLEPAKLRKMAEKVDRRDMRHVIFVLDVSPSMRLADAGKTETEKRSLRALTVLKQFFRAAPADQALYSVIATYSGAKPVVVDTKDPEVVLNIADGLPLSHIFLPGRTRIFAGLEEAARIAKPWPRDSASLILLTDGDTVPPTGMPKLPSAISETVVVGVGSTGKGTFINGHNSRQDVASLKQIAARLGGTYIDGNAQPIPPTLVSALAGVPEKSAFERLTRREYALIAIACGALGIALLPELLMAFGTSWLPGRRNLSPREQRTPVTTL